MTLGSSRTLEKIMSVNCSAEKIPLRRFRQKPGGWKIRIQIAKLGPEICRMSFRPESSVLSQESRPLCESMDRMVAENMPWMTLSVL